MPTSVVSEEVGSFVFESYWLPSDPAKKRESRPEIPARYPDSQVNLTIKDNISFSHEDSDNHREEALNERIIFLSCLGSGSCLSEIPLTVI